MYYAIGLLFLAAVASADNRIVGGSDVSSTSFAPWQASLQVSGSHFCGGSVISANYVMSACHCQNSGVQVIVGTLDYTKPGDSILASSFTCHPSYSSRTIDYDYAIIRLARATTLKNGQVEAIEVATSEYTSGTQALITGWGKVSGGIFGQLASTLQYTYTNLISNAQCKTTWGSQVTDRMQCAKRDGVSACNGDSGGPLAVNDNGTWKLVGNTSWGASGCGTGVASAWSKNSEVYSWIQSNSDI